ncbi:MAG TPA: hypothetical protein VD833_24625 [Vicinamibacterales bacterium]|nr:hypothetical protein [Vicinamibacterales bacterium]
MRVFRVHGVTLGSAIALPELTPSRASRPDCFVRLADGPRARKADRYHAWHAGGQTRLVFLRAGDAYVLRFPGLAVFEIAADGTFIDCRPRHGLPPSTLRHLLLDQVLPLVLSRAGRTALHASGVHVPGIGAVAFAGGSGRGKSTIAAALSRRRWPLIADDCVVVRHEPSRGPIVVPAYPGLRLWRETTRRLGLNTSGSRAVAHYTRKVRVRVHPWRSRPSALAAVFVLGPRYARGPAARVERLPPRDGCLALARVMFVLDIADRGQLQAEFAALTSIAAQVPIYQLRVRSAGDVDEAGDVIFDVLRGGAALRPRVDS